MSRNPNQFDDLESNEVTPREGRVSRNHFTMDDNLSLSVTPREGRVSRNEKQTEALESDERHAPRGACE